MKIRILTFAMAIVVLITACFVVIPAKEVQASAKGTWYVDVYQVTVYDEPGSWSNILGHLHEGDAVYVYADYDDFLEIYYDDQFGYVAKEVMTRLKQEWVDAIVNYDNLDYFNYNFGLDLTYRGQNASYAFVQVYYCGAWRAVKVLKKSPYTVKDMTKAEKRKYAVDQYAWTKIKTLKAKKKGFTVTWKRNSNEQGYIIQYSLKKSFKGKKTVKITDYDTTSKTIKKLKGGTKYYVRIRTYKKVDGKMYYGLWSDVKTVTTKKSTTNNNSSKVNNVPNSYLGK